MSSIEIGTRIINYDVVLGIPGSAVFNLKRNQKISVVKLDDKYTRALVAINGKETLINYRMLERISNAST